MRLVALVLAALLCSACIHIKIPLDTDLDRTQLGSKVGSAKMQAVLWLFMWGDSGTQAAAADGGITTITHADQELFIVLFGLYGRRTTIVYGD
jgi:hypothetical protein